MYSLSSRGRSDRSNASSCKLTGVPVTVRLSWSFSIIAGRSVTARPASGFREKLQRLSNAVAHRNAVGKLLHDVRRFLVAVAERQQCVQDVGRHRRRTMNVDGRRQVGAELVFQLEQNAIRCFLSNAGNLGKTPGLLQRDRLRELGNG